MRVMVRGNKLVVENMEHIEGAPPVCSPGSEGTAEEHVKGSQVCRWLIAEQAPDFRGVFAGSGQR